MIAFKRLRVIALPCPRNGQILDATHARFQIACVVPIVLISTLLLAFIGQSSDEGADFLLSDTDECYTHRLPQSFLHQLLKCFLTSYKSFDIVVSMSHWYPPGDLN